MTTCQHYKQQYTELKELHDKLTKGLEDFEIYGKTQNPNRSLESVVKRTIFCC